MIEITYQIILGTIQTIALIVGIIYYITIMRNQSKTRQIQIMKGANIIGDYQWELYNAQFKDFEDFMTKYNFDENPAFRKAYSDYFNELEQLGVYVKDGLLDVRYVALIGGGSVVDLWEKYFVVTDGFRKQYNSKRFFVEAEYLYQRVKDYFDKHPELAD